MQGETTTSGIPTVFVRLTGCPLRCDYCDTAYAFEDMANLATKAGVEGNRLRIHTPLIDMTKAQIIQTGVAHHVDYSLTVSCYQATENGAACGLCDSCRLRKQGFIEADIKDPTRYKNST
mgnify:CR=1 FL=1